MSELSEFFREKARTELGESEAKKTQSIQLLREWFRKHPFIKSGEFGEFCLMTVVST
jgi:hypothetical protein